MSDWFRKFNFCGTAYTRNNELIEHPYKDSSWISMMDNRLSLSRKLRGKRASYSIAIDKWEHNNLYDLCKQNFADSDIVDVAVEHNKKGTMGDHFSYSNEYSIFVISNSIKYLNEKIRDP